MAMHEYRSRYIEQLSVQVGERSVVVTMDRMDRIEAVEDGIRVYADGRSYRYNASFRDILEELDPGVFVEVTDTVAVNLEGVSEFDLLASGGCRLTLRDGFVIEASPSHREKLGSLSLSR